MSKTLCGIKPQQCRYSHIQQPLDIVYSWRCHSVSRRFALPWCDSLGAKLCDWREWQTSELIRTWRQQSVTHWTKWCTLLCDASAHRRQTIELVRRSKKSTRYWKPQPSDYQRVRHCVQSLWFDRGNVVKHSKSLATCNEPSLAWKSWKIQVLHFCRPRRNKRELIAFVFDTVARQNTNKRRERLENRKKDRMIWDAFNPTSHSQCFPHTWLHLLRYKAKRSSRPNASRQYDERVLKGANHKSRPQIRWWSLGDESNAKITGWAEQSLKMATNVSLSSLSNVIPSNRLSRMFESRELFLGNWSKREFGISKNDTELTNSSCSWHTIAMNAGAFSFVNASIVGLQSRCGI